MTRFKRILIAAAALVASLGLGAALYQANLADIDPMTCKEFGNRLRRVAGLQTDSFFVAVSTSYLTANGGTVPAAAGDYIIGDCAGTECVVQSDGCTESYSYTFRKSSAVAGWRLFLIENAPLYFGRGFKELATVAGAANVRFYRSFADVKTDCLANLTQVQCRDLISGVNDCWLQPGGGLCRYGLLYDVGIGGDQACSVGVNDVPYPCSQGTRSQEWLDNVTTSTFYTDEEMDLP